MKDGGEEREGDGGDGEGRLEDDDDLLAQSMEADEVGKMLRSTLSDLEMALEVHTHTHTHTHTVFLSRWNLKPPTGHAHTFHFPSNIP